MTTPINSVIAGVQVPVHLEVTSGEVKNAFLTNIAIVESILDLGLVEPPPTPAELEAAIINVNTPSGPIQITGAHNALNEAVNSLVDIATTGVLGTVDPNDPQSRQITYFLTMEMADRLDKLINILKAVGINTDQNGFIAASGAQVRQLLDLNLLTPLISEIVSESVAAGQRSTRSLQAMIELDYVRTGNEVLSEKLSELEESLTVTKGALETLTALQDLHNQVTVIGKGDFPGEFQITTFNTVVQTNIPPIGNINVTLQTNVVIGEHPTFAFSFTGSKSFFIPGASAGEQLPDNKSGRKLYISRYEEAASAFFGTPINPEALVGSSQKYQTVADMRVKATEILASLNAQIAIITQVSPDADIIERLSAVKSDLQIALEAGDASFALWLTDFFGAEGTAISEKSGSVQQNITFAISAGEAFNDTQKEEVRRFLFVFEEYYKSASAILSKITQIIEKIAQGIART